MTVRNTTESWGLPARLLHWSMAALILFQFGLGVYMTEAVSDLLERFRLIQIHKSWGFVIFALALARLAWRIVNPTPAMPDGTPRLRARAASISHALLYLLMLALPASGWIMVSAAPVQDLLGIDNMVFGWFALPDPWSPGVEAIELAAKRTHVVAALALAILLVAHAAAAIWHHLVDRDRVLTRMTFGRFRTPPRR